MKTTRKKKDKKIIKGMKFAIHSGYFYFKDKDGVVWQVIKTPYKEIPVLLNLGEGYEV